MFAKIKHLAIISDNYALLSRFYEALFGMKTSKSPRPESAVAIGDGYVGMNIIPQKLGRQAGLEHFGLEVEDVEKVSARLCDKYPSVQLIKRPTNRPFAGISTHDPEGYVFDLSQQDMTNRAEVYVEGEWKQERYVSHFVLRALNPANLAKFYQEIYELQELEKPADDPDPLPHRRQGVSGGIALAKKGLRGGGHRTPPHGSFGFQRRRCRVFQKGPSGLGEEKPRPCTEAGRDGGRDKAQITSEVQARPVSTRRSRWGADRRCRRPLTDLFTRIDHGCVTLRKEVFKSRRFEVRYSSVKAHVEP